MHLSLSLSLSLSLLCCALLPPPHPRPSFASSRRLCSGLWWQESQCCPHGRRQALIADVNTTVSTFLQLLLPPPHSTPTLTGKDRGESDPAAPEVRVVPVLNETYTPLMAIQQLRLRSRTDNKFSCTTPWRELVRLWSKYGESVTTFFFFFLKTVSEAVCEHQGFTRTRSGLACAPNLVL